MGQRSRLARAPDGSEYEIVVEAPGVGLWWHGPWRTWNTLTRKRTRWVTVSGDRWPWPLLRERFDTKDEADRRGEALAQSITSGETRPAGGPAWRRRRGASV